MPPHVHGDSFPGAFLVRADVWQDVSTEPTARCNADAYFPFQMFLLTLTSRAYLPTTAALLMAS